MAKEEDPPSTLRSGRIRRPTNAEKEEDIPSRLRSGRIRRPTNAREPCVPMEKEEDRPSTLRSGRIRRPINARNTGRTKTRRMKEVEEDRKGKKPIKSPLLRSLKRPFRDLSTIRIGESSSAPPIPKIPKEAYCTICMEPKRKFECFPLMGCSHMFCSSCISLYVAAKVEENVTSIRCPNPGCKDGFLEAEMCCPILPPDVFDRWCNALCESLIGSMKFYCPYKDCSALLIDETHEVIKESECPHCHRLFCAQCRVPWHVGLTCEGYQKLGADERGHEDVMLMHLARNCKWQRCRKCKYYVERIDGCMFMKCRCGFCFCYGCASEMKDHYCSTCKC